MNTSFIAGILAGIAGLLVFLIIHHLWIMPIWFILPLGLMIAAAGGLAVGWAYGELLPHLPPRYCCFGVGAGGRAGQTGLTFEETLRLFDLGQIGPVADPGGSFRLAQFSLPTQLIFNSSK